MMKQEEMKNTELFDLTQTIAARLFGMYTYPWEAVSHIGKCITSIGKHLPEEAWKEYLDPQKRKDGTFRYDDRSGYHLCRC